MDGIIYKTIDYKENDKLVYIITKDGKYSFILKNAKQVKSINRYPSQVLNKIKVDEKYLKKDKLNKLYEVSLIDDYFNLKQDYNNLLNIYKVLYLIDLLIDDNDNIIYLWLLEYLKQENIKTATIAFFIKFLKIQGLLINFHPLNFKDYKGFNIENNKLVLLNENLYIDFNLNICILINLLFISKFKDLNFDINENDIKILKKYINYMYNTYLGINLYKKGEE